MLLMDINNAPRHVKLDSVCACACQGIHIGIQETTQKNTLAQTTGVI